MALGDGVVLCGDLEGGDVGDGSKRADAGDHSGAVRRATSSATSVSGDLLDGVVRASGIDVLAVEDDGFTTSIVETDECGLPNGTEMSTRAVVPPEARTQLGVVDFAEHDTLADEGAVVALQADLVGVVTVGPSPKLISPVRPQARHSSVSVARPMARPSSS